MTPVQLENTSLYQNHHRVSAGRQEATESRTSNTAEDAVHQRAQLVLQMAMSLETSNHRRQRQLKQIESGKMHHVQQVIDEIMLEQPANLMTLLQEADPELLPTAKDLKERYQQKNGSNPKGGVAFDKHHHSSDEDTSSDDDDDDDDDEEGSEESETPQKEEGRSNLGSSASPNKKNKLDDAEFHKKQDQIIAHSQVPAALPTNIDPDSLRAHTAPLQEQLKRSYEAIIRLRENSDLRYEALEEKYNALKRERQVDSSAQKALAQKAGMPAVDLNQIGNEPMKEQLMQAYEALIRLRENSELRMNVLESKYLDLKRSHTEVDARNERLEEDLENTRMQLKRARQHNAQLYHSQKKNNISSAVASTASIKDRKKTRTLLLEFQVLAEKVASCENCQSANSKKLMKRLRNQLTKIEEEFMNNGEGMTDDESDTDDDDDDSVDGVDSDTLSSLSSTNRHDGAMALLGANWETISKIDVSKEEIKPGGRFANVSESKSEQRLRGKPSQFVACQSGVYCRIDHDMNQYGSSLEDSYQKAQAPPPPLPTPSQPQPQPRVQLEAPVKFTPQPAIRNAEIKPALNSAKKAAIKPAIKSAMKKPLPSLHEVDKEEDTTPQESNQTLPTTCSTKESDSQLSSLTFGESSVLGDSFALPSETTNKSAALSSDEPKETSRPEDPKEDSLSTPEEEPVRRPLSLSTPEEEPVKRTPPPSLVKRKSSRGLNGRPGLQKKSVSFAKRSVTIVEEESKKEVKDDEESSNKSNELNLVEEEAPRHLVAPKAPGEANRDREEEKAADSRGEDLDGSLQFCDEGSTDDIGKEGSMSSLVDRPHVDTLDSSAASTGSAGRSRRIPPAKLDPKERKAKQKAALRAAKMKARSVRQENKSRRRNKGDADDGASLMSGMSGISASSSIATDYSQNNNSKRGLFSNPFKRKNKALETAAGRNTGVPTMVQPEVSSTRSPPSPAARKISKPPRANGFAVEV